MKKIKEIFNEDSAKPKASALFSVLRLLTIIGLLAAAAFGQTTAFTYQGRLTDASMPANGNYDMQFRLFDNPNAGQGTQQGATVTNPTVAAASGVFTVTLDFGAAAFAAGTPLYVEISIRPANSTGGYTSLAPRQAITSAPTAIKALSATNANQLGGVNAANYLQTTGNGTNLTNLNASNITSGTLPDAQLSSNIAFRNQANTFTTNQTINGNLSQTGTTTDLNLTNGFVTRGTFNSGLIPATGGGTRMMFYPKKSAFRAGTVFSTEWDDANIGNDSIALGFGTTASGGGSTALGDSTVASGIISTAFGDGTFASGNRSTAMGSGTIASGNFSTALGSNTRASGDFSTVMGSLASTNSFQGSFVYGDTSTTNTVLATAANQFVVRAAGGFRFRTNAALTTGCDLPAGSGSFSCTSTKSQKENFAPMNGADVLRRLRLVPVNYWNYIGEGGGVRHLGAFSEDFYAAFNLGTDDKSIGLLDAAGVNMAAAKALDEKTENLQSQIEAQQKIIERQQQQIDALVKSMCAANPSAEVCKQENK